MNEILGIDLGTSSVKALIVRDGEIIAKAKAGYDEISPEGWYAALCKALRTLDLTRITAVDCPHRWAPTSSTTET